MNEFINIEFLVEGLSHKEHTISGIHCCYYWLFSLQTNSPACSKQMTSDLNVHTRIIGPSLPSLPVWFSFSQLTDWWFWVPIWNVQERGPNEPGAGVYTSGLISCCLPRDTMVATHSFISCLGELLRKGKWGREKTENIPNAGIKTFTFSAHVFIV